MRGGVHEGVKTRDQPVDRSVSAGSAGRRCPVECPVGMLNQPAVRQGTVGILEDVQGSRRPSWCDWKDRAPAAGTAAGRRPVEVPVCALNQRAVRLSAVTILAEALPESVEGGQRNLRGYRWHHRRSSILMNGSLKDKSTRGVGHKAGHERSGIDDLSKPIFEGEDESSHIPATGLHDHNAGRAMLSAGANFDQAHYAGCRRRGAKRPRICSRL
jgi:hypothetical protein